MTGRCQVTHFQARELSFARGRAALAGRDPRLPAGSTVHVHVVGKETADVARDGGVRKEGAVRRDRSLELGVGHVRGVCEHAL